ncbi:Cytochrome c oxidase assembly protein COX16 homolog, mitochondrial [Eumeta japonica]|uniref:Cytochrome c oxidase assembly protein COX16 homolog, mitochondrial n=1 Tax=Eumeta variegata TaxID=151549 RepID=A0A4C1UYK9_EUMVA|nr:Cytochrome c oxidase assembly protein COX16 homolog, mitochondrial [Eumeta japonica]
MDEIMKALKHLKVEKAAGYDRVSSEMLRYEFAPVKSMSNEEAEKLGLHKEKNVTLETVYEEIKDIDTENWENIRGPRPWENNLQNPKETKSK